MIAGTVTVNLEAVISLVVHGPHGRLRLERVIVDTGFNGCLTLPTDSIQRLGLTWKRLAFVELGDGHEVLTDIYEATIEWDGSERRATVDAADTESLAGMELMKSHRLTVEVIEGGQLTIEPLTTDH